MSDTETSSRRAEANRRNAQKSTGPKTAEGKDRSRFNALKHGMRAKAPILPGEDPLAFDARLESWTASLGPRDEVEQFLVRRAVELSWQLERADRALNARHAQAHFVHLDSLEAEADMVSDLGRRLFWDPRGPTCLYPHPPRPGRAPTKVSWTGEADDPYDPDRLVIALEASAMGCAWLIDRWTELRSLLERGLKWQAPDRFRSIRLLGHQPLDAPQDDRVRTIYRATWLMAPEQGPHAFNDVKAELDADEWNRWKSVVDARTPADPAEGEESGRSALLNLIDGELARLESLLATHLDRGEHEAIFDASAEGDRLRRYQATCDRMLLRVLETLRKRHREADSPRTKPKRSNDKVEPAPTQPRSDVEKLLDVLTASAPFPATNEANAPAEPARPGRSPWSMIPHLLALLLAAGLAASGLDLASRSPIASPARGPEGESIGHGRAFATPIPTIGQAVTSPARRPSPPISTGLPPDLVDA